MEVGGDVVRNANHIKAEADYSLGMKYREIAVKYDVAINTVKSWKQRYTWSRKGVHTKEKSVHTKKEENKGATKKKVEIDKPAAAPVIENDELTEKQRLFCIYYLKYFNATKAYQKAYDCSYEVAHSNAYRLMANEGITSEIDRLKEERAKGDDVRCPVNYPEVHRYCLHRHNRLSKIRAA